MDPDYKGEGKQAEREKKGLLAPKWFGDKKRCAHTHIQENDTIPVE